MLGDTFSVNLEPLPEASEDTRTMRWWASQPAAYDAMWVQWHLRRFVCDDPSARTPLQWDGPPETELRLLVGSGTLAQLDVDNGQTRYGPPHWMDRRRSGSI